VEAGLVARATAAASSLAEAANLRVDETVVIQNSNALALRLLPCDTFARTAVVGQEVAAFEVRVAEELAAVAAPTASLDPRVEPRVHERDGFAVTFWTYYRPVPDLGSPARYADALYRLHAAMRGIEIDAPHFTERVAAAERRLTHRHETPAERGPRWAVSKQGTRAPRARRPSMWAHGCGGTMRGREQGRAPRPSPPIRPGGALTHRTGCTEVRGTLPRLGTTGDVRRT